LNALLENLPSVPDPDLIVGFDTSDDAGVYRLSDELALVVTADFITPPTDDPELFGRIAAANALSDVYAMGGRPVTCVNLVAFPSKKLASSVLAGIIRGAQQKITEAGAVLAGGHTVEDPEPKFGLAVTGLVHPDRCWTNAGAHSGDALVLTKPIGSGVILNANLKGRVPSADLEACLTSMETLNKTAAETAADFDIHAATDVTGFGLAGHALEMARGADLRFELEFDTLPVFSSALAMYQSGISTGSNDSNREMAAPFIDFDRQLSTQEASLLFDPQTNGGLLFALPESEADPLVARLKASGIAEACRIGQVTEKLPQQHNLRIV
jgi:selenide,water dikinase